MSLVINNNLMAANTARTLNQHYGRLQTSTQRLSSGLRINSAADDAAGLAIRELQRADIAALQQGARNANDAISMIQVADGALGIIDEKLIRMKELAEQAATGTYDSTQRLMIESEYQAMASEITRIANATDFNGTKLLDGTLDGEHDGSGLVSKGEMKIHFGTGNDSAEDYYYIHIGECTSQAFGLGNASTWQDVQNRGVKAFTTSLQEQIRNDSTLTAEQKGVLLNQVSDAADALKSALENATDPLQAAAFWNDTPAEGQKWVGNSDLMERYLAAANDAAQNNISQAIKDEVVAAIQAAQGAITPTTDATDIGTALDTLIAGATAAVTNQAGGLITDKEAASVNSAIKTAVNALRDTDWANMQQADINTLINDTVNTAVDGVLSGAGQFWNGLRDTEKQKLQYAWGQAAVYNLANGTGVTGTTPDYGLDPTVFGQDAAGNAIGNAADMFTKALEDMQAKIGNMDFAGYTIETQEDAQHALDAINNAIVEKDKIRAHLGATQNRLENTISNLNIQAENLQAAESRISDVDVATEMTQFVRNQILTQSAVAMLGQANSLPQMAMQLIGG